MSMQSIVAIDLGLKRIGLAHLCAGVIVPLAPILRQNRNQAACAVRAVLEQKQAELVLLGVAFDGSSAETMRKRAQHFAQLLGEERTIVFFDESYSSIEAQQRCEARLPRHKGYLDSIAAMILLERYWERQNEKEKR